METLELKIIWVNGTHATVNLARRIRGQRRQKRADGKAGLNRQDEGDQENEQGKGDECIKGCKRFT